MALAHDASPRPKLTTRLVLAVLPFVLAVACGGATRDNAIKIEGPSLPPLQTVPIRTLEPVPTDVPSPTATPAASVAATATPTPVPPPGNPTMTSHAGTQTGAPSSFCWSEQEGGPSTCYTHNQQNQPTNLAVTSGEKVILRIAATIPPDEESVRPFQGSRSGYPSQSVDPALQTDLTVNLPAGNWSMDLCATWHNRGQPICWLFAMAVSK